MSVNQGNSNEVTSNQSGVHDNLADYLDKYSIENYGRPCANFSRDCWSEILGFVDGDSVIFDLGCGVGESSFKLAKMYSDQKIVGVDRSLSRLDRNNHFKHELPSNLLFVRGELLDLIPLIFKNQDKLNITSIYLLYPNPYPKKHHVKKRLHGNPVAIFLFNIRSQLIFRSNWKLYLEEVQFTANYYSRNSKFTILEDDIEPFTPFERKFMNSNQKVYELLVH
jgi:tRNA G46 methylase TrmB